MTENILKILFIQIYLAKIARAKVSAGKNPSETYKGEAIPYDQQYKHSFSYEIDSVTTTVSELYLKQK